MRLELYNIESFVLERLLTPPTSRGDPLINIGDLMDSMDNTMAPLFDQALENLMAQNLLHSEDGENYQIIPDGINELENRKKEAIPL